MRFPRLLLAPGVVIATAVALTDSSGQACSYAGLYPRQYVCYKTGELDAEALDGDLSKPVWQDVPWTDNFVDISTSTKPYLRTRAKMRWDDSYLYIGAEMEEPRVWGTFTSDDEIIFKDNDFEVFVDPNGTNHFYKEFEVNVLNARWSLCLNKPYGDGGYENSTRVDKEKGWSMLPGTKSAVKVVPTGALNNPSIRGISWSVEIALPLADLVYNNTMALPDDGTFWRISFSRVQWNVEANKANDGYVKAPRCTSCPTPGTDHEDNWVWTPQGEIAMHNPELWGILQFSTEEVNATAFVRYDQWPSRAAAMAVYYAQKGYAADHAGDYTDNTSDLLPYSSSRFALCTPAEVAIDLGRSGNGASFRAVVQPPGSPWAAVITEDRHLTVISRTSVQAFWSAAMSTWPSAGLYSLPLALLLFSYTLR